MNKEGITRIDDNGEMKELLLPHCRLKYGGIWEDPIRGHRVGCLDATNQNDIGRLMGNNKATLAVQDPPYNVCCG